MPATPRKPPRIWVATLLGLIWPGAGQIYANQSRSAAFFGGMFIAGIIALNGIRQLTPSVPLVITFFSIAVALIGLQFVSGVQAFFVSRRARRAGVPKGNRLVALALAVASALGYGSLDFLHHATGLNWHLFHVAARSMEPTLRVGDQVVASHGRRTTRTLKRGDVVTTVDAEGVAYIRRLIGLPGDKVQIRNGSLHMKGVAVPAAIGELQGVQSPFGEIDAEIVVEILGDKTYRILNLVDESVGDNTADFLVPAGHVFVLGDNRDNANDSRFVGPLPAEHITGIVYIIYWSPERGVFRLPQPVNGKS